jgi:hypothetical protein
VVASVLTPRFPLHLTDEEGVVHRLANAAAIEQALEFWDDYQGSYVCVDADARRVRLIVWNLELLVCQRVAPDYDREDIYLVAGSVGQAGQRHIEMHRDNALRALIEEEATLSVEPGRWAAGAPANPDWPGGNESSTEGQVRAFHDRWMRARLGVRFP